MLSVVAPVAAQRGDREGHTMAEVWREMDVPEAPVLSPAEGLASLAVAPGFRVELVAAEPLVEDPIVIRWDPEGRLWAVEMRGFMPTVDGKGEQEPVGQVVVLEDLDHDGTMDKSTVFAGELVLARALLLVNGGALIAEPPNLWYCEDTDDDLVCDKKTRVTAYGSNDPDVLEHTENGLLWALDNWIYNAKSDRRFRFRDGKVLEEATHFRGQWGITQDDYGRLYYNTNSRYLFADFFPSAYLRRNPNYRPDGSGRGINERLVEDEAVFSTRVNPGINRGYMGRMLREDGRLAVTTSVSGLAIYRGHQFPDSFRGDVFIPEPAGNVVTYHQLEDDGLEIRSRHVTYDDQRWGQREFLASTDERFRPVDCAVGPDGALYIVDMYRGILQHQKYVTTFLRKQILERGLDEPLGLGRIYRVVHDGSPIDRRPPPLATTTEQVKALSHQNGWVRDTAQRLLVERRAPESAAPLRRLARSKRASEVGRLHALAALEGQDLLESETVWSLLDSRDPWLRIWGLRAGERMAGELGEPFRKRALDWVQPPRNPARSDTLLPLRLQAAFTLGELRDAASRQALIDLLLRDPGNELFRQASLSGLEGVELEALLEVSEVVARGSGGLGSRDLGSRNRGSRTTASVDREELALAIGDLAASAFRATPTGEPRLASQDGNAPPLDRLFEVVGELDETLQAAALAGMAGVAGDPDFEPRRLSAQPALLTAAGSGEHVAKLAENVAKLKEKVFWGARSDLAAGTVPDAVLEETKRQGARHFRLCNSCHGDRGEGLEGMGPRLTQSEWVLGPPEVLVKIVLDGLEGKLVIDGEPWDDVMPGFRLDRRLSDQALADMLTFLRTSWGHDASPVSPEIVRELRADTSDRETAWQVEELVPP